MAGRHLQGQREQDSTTCARSHSCMDACKSDSMHAAAGTSQALAQAALQMPDVHSSEGYVPAKLRAAGIPAHLAARRAARAGTGQTPKLHSWDGAGPKGQSCCWQQPCHQPEASCRPKSLAFERCQDCDPHPRDTGARQWQAARQPMSRYIPQAAHKAQAKHASNSSNLLPCHCSACDGRKQAKQPPCLAGFAPAAARLMMSSRLSLHSKQREAT